MQKYFVMDWDQVLDPNVRKHVVNMAQNSAVQPRRTVKATKFDRYSGKFKPLWVLICKEHLCLQL